MTWKSEKRKNDVYILDAYALLAFLEAEEGGEIVKEFLQTPGALFYISVVNFGEVYYIVYRERGKESAQLVENELKQSNNIRIIDATWERAKIAAELKSRGRISYADCFAAALAIEKEAPLITGDKEFSVVADKIQVIWLE